MIIFSRKNLMTILTGILLFSIILTGCKKAIDYSKQEGAGSDYWIKIGNNLFFDKNSVRINEDLVGGHFKQFNLSENKNYNYVIIWAGVYCDLEKQNGVEKMEYPIYYYYDENDKLIPENIIHKSWLKEKRSEQVGITYPKEEENGEIFYDTLCGFYSE